MNPRTIITLAVVVSAIAGIWAYTAWQRGDATKIAVGHAIETTVKTTDKATGIKNEIRKRPVSDALTAGRLSAGAW